MSAVEKMIKMMPDRAKIGLLKMFVPQLLSLIAEGYKDRAATPEKDFDLQQGEIDFATLLFETRRYRRQQGDKDHGSKMIAKVCTIDSKGTIVRQGLAVYDLMSLIVNIEEEIDE